MGHHEGLKFTLFRPFNFVGPGLDSILTEKEGSSRVLTQFLGQLLRGEPIQLVDGGAQRRCFVHIDDGIEALVKIIANAGGVADGKIYNIGNPDNDLSVKELAEQLIAILKTSDVPEARAAAAKAQLNVVSADTYYGTNYQDMNRRKPSIKNTMADLNWKPKVSGADMLTRTVAYFVNEFYTREKSVYDFNCRTRG
jgi:nucleoside-diphosphate-sugar epimerase